MSTEQEENTGLVIEIIFIFLIGIAGVFLGIYLTI